MPSLNRHEAAARSVLISVRSYRIDLDLRTGDERFRSTTRILFDATRSDAQTFVEVSPAALHSVVLNGRPLDLTPLTDGRFPLDGLEAENELVVVADMDYSRECRGLHRYEDPADGRIYVYAFVYIDNAPRVFACFDQPDLKAPFTFGVRVPEEWQVIGTSDAAQVAAGYWQLSPTQPQASYLTTFVAGPFRSFHSEHEGVPLGLHCRASLAGALEADLDELREVTGQCLDAYHDLFGVRYPFGRLDQVFVPELTVLSLDHPGCILLREQYIFSSAATTSERETRAVVIAHGLSLMWMAGLVTNRWWDDLWLSQAFADYMAHRITSEATRFSGPLATFSARRKGQAYVADQRPSTHPVRLDAPDVQTVLLTLDRISYFKGHSALRQLATRIGTDGLRAGLQTYFTRHAYGTATATEFLDALAAGAGVELTEWAESWFGEPNVNTLSAEIVVTDGHISAATVRQTAPDSHPVLRPHTFDIGLYGDGRGVVRVKVDGPRTELPALVGMPAPRLVLLNDGDLTYAKVRFDETSLAALPELMPELSPVNRGMVWCALLMSVQDGVLAPEAHLGLVTRMIEVETELSILTEVLEQAQNDVADRFLHPDARPDALSRLADSCRRRIAVLQSDDQRRIVLLRALIDVTTDIGELQTLLRAKPDADLQWRIRHRLAVLGELSEQEIAAAEAADPGVRSTQYGARCRAARPDSAAKRAAWDRIMSDAGLSNYERWALAEGFWKPEQVALTAGYVERFFAEIPDAVCARGDLGLDMLVRSLYPRFAATWATLDLSTQLLAREDLPLALRRRVADSADELRRVVAAREAVAA